MFYICYMNIYIKLYEVLFLLYISYLYVLLYIYYIFICISYVF